VDHLVERFGPVLDRDAAFKAKSLVAARVQARLEKTARRSRSSPTSWARSRRTCCGPSGG